MNNQDCGQFQQKQLLFTMTKQIGYNQGL